MADLEAQNAIVAGLQGLTEGFAKGLEIREQRKNAEREFQLKQRRIDVAAAQKSELSEIKKLLTKATITEKGASTRLKDIQTGRTFADQASDLETKLSKTEKETAAWKTRIDALDPSDPDDAASLETYRDSYEKSLQREGRLKSSIKSLSRQAQKVGIETPKPQTSVRAAQSSATTVDRLVDLSKDPARLEQFAKDMGASNGRVLLQTQEQILDQKLSENPGDAALADQWAKLKTALDNYQPPAPPQEEGGGIFGLF